MGPREEKKQRSQWIVWNGYDMEWIGKMDMTRAGEG